MMQRQSNNSEHKATPIYVELYTARARHCELVNGVDSVQIASHLLDCQIVGMQITFHFSEPSLLDDLQESF